MHDIIRDIIFTYAILLIVAMHLDIWPDFIALTIIQNSTC